MNIQDAPGFAAFQAKRAELTAEQQANGPKTALAKKLAREAAALFRVAAKQSGQM
jgi:hypothetical protein